VSVTSEFRERERAALRAEKADAMLTIFVTRGFQNVTAEEAAREVGISRATFFRYFGSKEEAVVAALESGRFDFADSLRAMPAAMPDAPWALVRAAFQPRAAEIDKDLDRKRARTRMIMSEPTLRARLTERRGDHVERLADALAERLDDRLSARVIASAGLAAYDLAWRIWAESESETFSSVLDAVFARMKAL
jgi:AcrR family transcriptional regulator